MNEIKVGDRIRILSWEEMVKKYKVDEDGDIVDDSYNYFYGDEKYWCEKCGTVTSVNESEIEIDRNYVTYDSFVEKIDTYSIEDGDIVETKNGNLYLALKGHYFNMNGNGYMGYFVENGGFSVSKIYELGSALTLDNIKNKYGLRLKYGAPKKKMTLKEIADILGYEVEIVE